MTKEDRCAHYISAFKIAALAGKGDVLADIFEAAVKSRIESSGQALEGATIYVTNKVRTDVYVITDNFKDMHEVFNWANADATSSSTAYGVLAGLKKLGIQKPQDSDGDVLAFLQPHVVHK